MKKLITILLLCLPFFGFCQIQNDFKGVQKIRDTLKIGENGASHIGVLQLYGNGSGNIRIQPASAAGTYTLTLPTALPISNGYVWTFNTDGTSSFAASTGMTNPMTTAGDIIYGGSSGVPTRLAPNTTGTNKFVSMTSSTIGWNALVAGDIPDISATYQTKANLSTDVNLGASNTLYASQLAVKTYVDNTASAILPKGSNDYATTAALPTNIYSNGSSGVGATLTGVSTGTLTVDGHVMALNEKLLVQNEATAANNGYFTVTVAGAVGVSYVLTRRTDFDQAAEMVVGSETFISGGSQNIGKKFTLSGTVTTVGTTAVNFVLTGGASGVAWGAITGTIASQTDLATLVGLRLLASSNLSDLTNAGTARTNLGATTVGANIFTLTNPSAIRFIKVNADNTVTARTAAEMLSDIGAQASGSYAASGANTDITSVLLNQTGLVIKGASANALILKPNETLSTNRTLNLIVNDADRTINLTGNLTLSGNLVTTGAFNTTLATGFTGTLTLPTATSTLATTALTETFTNKRVTPRIGTVASSATPTINTDNVDYFSVTALATNITSMTSGLSGTPTDGQYIHLSFLDNGAPRSITWGTGWEAGNVPLPLTTVISTRMDLDFIWNSVTTKWRLLDPQAAAAQLTGATLASGVTSSSLTSFGSSPTIVTPSFTTGFTIGGAAASGKIPIGNGTNYVASTPTYPNVASTSGKIIKSDGTNLVMSTETYATPGTSGNIMQSDGTNWTSTTNKGGWTELRVAGSDFTTTSTSLVDITGLVSGTLSTATLYEFEAVLYVNSTSTAGMAVGVQQSGTGSGQIGVLTGSATSGAATGIAIASNALNTATAPCVLVAGDGTIVVKGYIKTGSSGTPTISCKVLKTTSGTAKVYISSVFRYRLAQ